MPIDGAANNAARDQLIAALRGGRMLGVTGAGVSFYAGYGTWWDVLHDLGEAVRRQSGADGPDPAEIIRLNPEPLHCARELGRLLGPQFADFIQTEFGPNGAAPAEVLFRIVNLPFTHFLTFNLDTSTERVHGNLGRSCHTLSSASDTDLFEFLRHMDLETYSRRVLHLHGMYSERPELITLTSAGYTRLYRNNSVFRNFLWSLLVSKQFLFMGFGFNDRDVNTALWDAARDLGEDHNPNHFAIMGLFPCEDGAAIRNTYHQNYKIEPVYYEIRGDRDHPDHAGFVEHIVGIADAVGTAGRPEGPVVPLEPVGRIVPPPQGDDIRRAQQLGDAIIDRADPGGNDV